MESLPELVASVVTESLRPGGPCIHQCGSHTPLACGCHQVSGPWTLVAVPGTLLCVLREVSIRIFASATAGQRDLVHFTEGELPWEEMWLAKVTHPTKRQSSVWTEAAWLLSLCLLETSVSQGNFRTQVGTGLTRAHGSDEGPQGWWRACMCVLAEVALVGSDFVQSYEL